MHTQKITPQHQASLDSAQIADEQDVDDYQPEFDRRNFGQANPLTPDQKIALGNILEALRHV